MAMHDPAIRIRYKNYKGEVAVRLIVPLRIFYGSNEYHKTDQWLIEAYDMDKRANRTFALKDIQEWLF